MLDGGTKNDRMTGNAGNDTYYIDHVGDRVFEVLGKARTLSIPASTGDGGGGRGPGADGVGH